MTFPSQSGQFFFQAGYVDPPLNNNCASFEWFVEAWFNSTILFANFGGCGTTGSHVFALANFGKDPSTGQYKWQWKMDSTIIGSPLMLNDATAPSNSAGVVSEITMPGFFIVYGMATVVYSPTIH